MADILVYDKDMTAVGVFDVQLSQIWERRYYEAGYFELHLPQTDHYNALMERAVFLLRADASEGGVITYVNKRVNEKGDAEITLIGRFLSYLFEWRPVHAGAGNYSGRNAEWLMRHLVEVNVMDETRGGYLPNVRLGELCGSEKVIKNIRISGGKTLHAVLSEIAQMTGIGFRLRAAPAENLLYFECFEGLDKSVGQSDNPRVIFSPDYDTIRGKAEYTEDDSVTCNVVAMRYSGELGAVTVRYNPDNVTGLELREKVFTTDQCAVGADGQLDIRATENLLKYMARDHIHAVKREMNVSAAYSGTYVYKRDYDIGDIVTVQYNPYGITMRRRIHKITENYTDAGKQIIPLFGAVNPAGEDKEDIDE